MTHIERIRLKMYKMNLLRIDITPLINQEYNGGGSCGISDADMEALGLKDITKNVEDFTPDGWCLGILQDSTGARWSVLWNDYTHEYELEYIDAGK